ncbi:hypothetical protein Ppro_2382 [Pelobacter propionicus DSM 2379]|uniref:Uncharacterized protein n=2 Tax=Pelobacter propionicus TaxID=29543 RepID=A1ARL8_PELPD|nr:hypothetical protein Ppro_2382 [Pelobacter propionicus DSM 2379]
MRNFIARPCMRQRIWSAMRIMTRFTIPDLCRVVEGATTANVQSYVSRLHKEGYVGKIGKVRRGYAGEYQGYQLVKNTGPTMPVLLKGRHKKESETERQTGKETEEQIEIQTVRQNRGLLPRETGALP